jgi:uncharacterized linocin/CFP29 family protein
MKNILRLPTELEQNFLTFTSLKIENKMKKQEISVKEQWRQADKEWADIFSEVLYGAPVQELLENKAKEVTKEVTLEVTKEVTSKVTEEVKMNTNRAVVVHLYHTIGLNLAQIAGTVQLTEKEVKLIIEASKKN